MSDSIQRLTDWFGGVSADKDSILGSGIKIWSDGGWAMIALAAVALFIFAIGFNVFLRLRRKRTSGLAESTWRLWMHEPEERRGAVGELFDTIDRITEDGSSTVHDAFSEVQTKESAPFERDLRLMSIAVGAAPLVGLLGTVTGMLATFNALASDSGGDQTMAMIAEGISEALYTTETGLVIALPGLFFHYYLSRRFERFRHFLQLAETAWAQNTYDATLKAQDKRLRGFVEGLTRQEIARRIMARLSSAAPAAASGPSAGSIPGAAGSGA